VTRIALDDPRLYLNRHLQWMAFNHRVLEEARDPGTPLLERVTRRSPSSGKRRSN
jgi:polyphosphate kinase